MMLKEYKEGANKDHMPIEKTERRKKNVYDFNVNVTKHLSIFY
jgi:hypothetical protein